MFLHRHMLFLYRPKKFQINCRFVQHFFSGLSYKSVVSQFLILYLILMSLYVSIVCVYVLVVESTHFKVFWNDIKQYTAYVTIFNIFKYLTIMILSNIFSKFKFIHFNILLIIILIFYKHTVF